MSLMTLNLVYIGDQSLIQKSKENPIFPEQANALMRVLLKQLTALTGLSAEVIWRGWFKKLRDFAQGHIPQV